MARVKTADIYRLVNRVTGRQYIGVTTAGYGTRWRNHRTDLRAGRHPAKLMQADFDAHGIDSFEISLLEEVRDISTIEDREWTLLTEAIASGAALYNNRRPLTCEACGRRFLGKPGTRYCQRSIVRYADCYAIRGIRLRAV